MKSSIRDYLAAIGRRGGSLSKRKLSPEAARSMVKVREARRAFKKYYGQCFWSYDPDFLVKEIDIKWVAEQLMKNGGSEAWRTGAKLCP
jgi:hypothetical protein